MAQPRISRSSKRSSAPPPLRRGSSTQTRNAQASPNSPYSLVMPDPDTGLDMFPRLPELLDDTSAAASSAAAEAAAARVPIPSPGLSYRVAMGVRSLLGSSPINLSVGSGQNHDRDHHQRASISSGSSSPGHVYCRHTWDQRCRCPVVMALGNGDYCEDCWSGRCVGETVR